MGTEVEVFPSVADLLLTPWTIVAGTKETGKKHPKEEITR